MSDARSDPILRALRLRGSPIRRIRYRANRSVLLSLSRDGRTLNSHACFRDAPPEVVSAIAAFMTARRGSAAARRALARIRGWPGTREGVRRVREERPRVRRRRVNGPDTMALRALFDDLNGARFGNTLPSIPLRVSHRMTRSLGTIRYGPGPNRIQEIAISHRLLLAANRRILEDTMLHEMAHAEAYLRHGHRGHGSPWRRVARRVGCTPRASCRDAVAGPDHGRAG